MLHFALGHFPIALLITGGLLLLVALISGSKSLRDLALAMSTAGTAFAVPTVIAGLWIASAHSSHHGDMLASHRLIALATLAVSSIAVFSHLLREKIANADIARNFLFLVAAVLAGGTGYAGAEMAHGGMSGGHSHSEASAQHTDIHEGSEHHGATHDHGSGDYLAAAEVDASAHTAGMAGENHSHGSGDDAGVHDENEHNHSKSAMKGDDGHDHDPAPHDHGAKHDDGHADGSGHGTAEAVENHSHSDSHSGHSH